MMFGEYDDIEAIEDDLYCEDSSSEGSIDSEVEFHLYSQVHYAQALEDANGQEETNKTRPVTKQNSVRKHDQKSNFIVISDSEIHTSDSPDVIILSDTPDEDSIYKSKLQNPTTSAESSNFSEPISSKPTTDHLHDTQNSKKQATPRRKNKSNQKAISVHRDGIHMIHKILVIEDSSNDEDADDVTSIPSESDNLERWMLLGGEKDDGDDDILLNLEGCGTSSAEGETEISWAISDKDLEAQIGNYVAVRRNNRYYTLDKNVTCRNCDKRGHLSKNCPDPKKIPPCCLCAQRGHLQNSCPARFCLNCCLPGHCSRECLEREYWKKHCNRCAMRGHYADACPEIWRQYHLTTKPGPLKRADFSSDHTSMYCYNCAEEGHYGYECREKRMFGGTFPTFPFIYYYDNEYDIKRNDERAKKRVQELQEAGLLPMALKRSQMDSAQKRHSHKKKRKMSKEHDKRDDRHHKKLKKNYYVDTLKGRKHQKDDHGGNYSLEEDFPRGGHVNTFRKSRRANTHCNFDLPRNRGKAEIVQASLGAAKNKKKKKKKKKQKSYTSSSPTRDESLFLIKQRKKKPKEKPSF
nr:zinc finger CCHC domain-containing protein 7 [Anolis sagrei ordinatus]